MNSSRALIIAAAMGTAMAASVATSGAAMNAGGTGELYRPLAPAGLQLAEADRSSATPVTEDQKARIRAELEKFSPDGLNSLAANTQAAIDDAINREQSLPPARQAYLLGEVHRVTEEWDAAHSGAERADRDQLAELLTRIAAVGVSIDLIVPAVQHVREAAARNSSAPPAASADRGPAVIIEHRR
jgi:hypothetical protein